MVVCCSGVMFQTAERSQAERPSDPRETAPAATIPSICGQPLNSGRPLLRPADGAAASSTAQAACATSHSQVGRSDSIRVGPALGHEAQPVGPAGTEMPLDRKAPLSAPSAPPPSTGGWPARWPGPAAALVADPELGCRRRSPTCSDLRDQAPRSGTENRSSHDPRPSGPFGDGSTVRHPSSMKGRGCRRRINDELPPGGPRYRPSSDSIRNVSHSPAAAPGAAPSTAGRPRDRLWSAGPCPVALVPGLRRPRLVPARRSPAGLCAAN